jgi:hypothetical protein
MRIRTCLSTALTAAAILTGNAAPTLAADMKIYVCTDDTNVRSKPSTKVGHVRGTCWKGQGVPVRCFGPGQKIGNNPAWYLLDRPDKMHWIHSSLARPASPAKIVGRC